MAICIVFGWNDDSGPILQDRRRSAEYYFSERGTSNSYVLRSTAFSPQSSWSKRVMPSRAARRDPNSGVNICQRALWSEELDDKKLRGALGCERDLELGGCSVF